MDFPTKLIYQDRAEAEKQYATQAAAFQKSAREIMDFAARKSGKLLDVGCGVGWVVAEAKKRGFDAVGIDEAAPYVSVGKKYLKANLQSISLENFRTSRKFDIVVLNHVLEHIEKVEEFLEKIKTLLAPGGALVVACPNNRSLMHFIFRDRWYGRQPAQHVWQFTPEILRTLLLKNGFRIKKMRITSLVYTVLGWKGLIFKILVFIGNITGFGDQVFISATMG